MHVHDSRYYLTADTMMTTSILAPAPAGAEQQRRVDAAVAALAPNTRRMYGLAWAAWQRWAHERGRPELPADPTDIADYLEARHAAGASPSTIRLARTAIAKVHQVSVAADPTADTIVRDTLKRIGREGRDRGRGQVAAVSWEAADAAALLAANSGDSLGFRDAALIKIGSDALLRVSELAALQVTDIQQQSDGSGTVTVRSSKTDQDGRGHARYLGPPTIAAYSAGNGRRE